MNQIGEASPNFFRPPEQEGQMEGYEPPESGGWGDYPLDELSIRDERRTAIDVVRRISKGSFVMDSDFQRDFVWEEQKQSRLIESILLRIPLPVFYVAEDDQGRYIVVDGRQRLTTLQRFFDGKLKLKLPDRPELHGKTFDELLPRWQYRVEDCQLHFYIIDHKAPERARLDIFERVNGGEVLTRQQMRNAMYNGAATRFLRDEARTKLFLKTTDESLNVKKMTDREFVNRFVSFSLLPLEEYKGDMDRWLADGLRECEKLSEEERKQLSRRFRRTLANNLKVFGDQAFRKPRPSGERRGPINASLSDVLAQGLADRAEAEVADRAEQIWAALCKLLEDADFNKAVTYGPNALKEVQTRFDMFSKMLHEVFGAD